MLLGGNRKAHPDTACCCRDLSLSKGRIEYKDGMTSIQLSISDLNMTVKVYLSQDRFTTSIKNSRIRVSTPAYPEISGTFKATLEYDRGRTHLEKVELSTADATITLSGDAGLLPDSPLDLKITGRSGPEVISRYLDFLKPSKKQKSSRFEVSGADPGDTVRTRHRGEHQGVCPSFQTNTFFRMGPCRLRTGTGVSLSRESTGNSQKMIKISS